ncbi:MAG: PHP domain-containing protein [Treponema sp.]|jgi:predicted metal-dependent phosphoesterase TrpH|nr:PHP domain-containing protein [Treponema sp.]
MINYSLVMIDLHTHSSASDGDLSPAELIAAAANQGLSAIALTDHDTIKGLKSAEETASKYSIRFIPGIEMEIAWSAPQGEFHLLGLGLTRPSPAFLSAVDSLARSRETRNREILKRLNTLGIHADYEEVRSFSGGGSVGRPHFASLLISRGLVKSHELAFTRYLGRGKPLFVPKAVLEFDQAAGLIKESGGIAVLAHPMSLYISWGRLPDIVRDLKDRGLDGLEAWHPTAEPRSCKRLEALGKSLGLYVTEGSDFHGKARPERKLGHSAGDRKIADSVLEAIPELCPPLMS